MKVIEVIGGIHSQRERVRLCVRERKKVFSAPRISNYLQTTESITPQENAARKTYQSIVTFLTLNAVERLAALKAAPRAIASSPKIRIKFKRSLVEKENPTGIIT